MGSKSEHQGEVLSCSKSALIQMKQLLLRVMYTGDYKAIVSVNVIHNHGGFLAGWKAGENQRQGSPSWNAVMENSGQCREIII